MTTFPPLEWVAPISRPYAKDTNHRLQEFLQVFNSQKIKKVTATLEGHMSGFCSISIQDSQLLIAQGYLTAGCEGKYNQSKFKENLFKKSERMKTWNIRRGSSS